MMKDKKMFINIQSENLKTKGTFEVKPLTLILSGNLLARAIVVLSEYTVDGNVHVDKLINDLRFLGKIKTIDFTTTSGYIHYNKGQVTGFGKSEIDTLTIRPSEEDLNITVSDTLIDMPHFGSLRTYNQQVRDINHMLESMDQNNNTFLITTHTPLVVNELQLALARYRKPPKKHKVKGYIIGGYFLNPKKITVYEDRKENGKYSKVKMSRGEIICDENILNQLLDDNNDKFYYIWDYYEEKEERKARKIKRIKNENNTK